MYTKEGKLQDNREYLRVKVKSLAEEARIIRKEETRTYGAIRDGLHLHRVGVVRYEARATHLAYGLIRGRALERIEKSDSRTDHLWKKVRAMIEKYGPCDTVGRGLLLERCKN